jgi:hypothetical protein
MPPVAAHKANTDTATASAAIPRRFRPHASFSHTTLYSSCVRGYP